MAFDEEGQADIERKVARSPSARLRDLTGGGLRPVRHHLRPEHLAIATGMQEHDYAKAFIDATRIIKRRCPGVKVSGGVSNLSFAFRGNDVVREAMHSAFLPRTPGGLDMAS